jgi:hypothetical protein
MQREANALGPTIRFDPITQAASPNQHSQSAVVLHFRVRWALPGHLARSTHPEHRPGLSGAARRRMRETVAAAWQTACP